MAHGPLTSAAPMEAASRLSLPEGEGWWFEPKWDGFRCLAFKETHGVTLQAKSGKPLTRYFPEVAARLAKIDEPRFVLDGELLVQAGGVWSFDALQMRLHPAESRIRRLAGETPAILALFDMLVSPGGHDLRGEPWRVRHAALSAFEQQHGDAQLTLTPGTDDPALAAQWLADAKLEGVVAKRMDGPYAEGERAMVKVKRQRTADCVVGGFRYGTDSTVVGSLLLGLYDDEGRLNHIGFTSGIAAAEKPALTRRLESLKGGVGFTGDAPGGPSRWSDERSSAWTPLKPELVVEVAFDHVSGNRLRHGARLIRFRPDKAPTQCRMDQIASPLA
jgi:ATP-dependent DNA ligase